MRGGRSRPYDTRRFRRSGVPIRTSLAGLLIVVLLNGILIPDAAAQIKIQDPGPSPTEPITIAADSIRNWTQADTRILLLHGNVFVAQGLKRIRANHAVVWIAEGNDANNLKHLELYAEGSVRVDGPRRKFEAGEVLESFQTRAEVSIEMKERLTGPAVDDQIYRNGEARRTSAQGNSQRVQLTAFQPESDVT